MPPDSFHTFFMPNLSIYLRVSPYALLSPGYNGRTVLPTTQGQLLPVSTRSCALCSCNCPSFSCIVDYFPFLVIYFHQHTSTLYFFSTHTHTQRASFLCYYPILSSTHSTMLHLILKSPVNSALPDPNNQFFPLLQLTDCSAPFKTSDLILLETLSSLTSRIPHPLLISLPHWSLLLNLLGLDPPLQPTSQC